MSSMRVRFWGVRGSIPTPGGQTAVYGGNTSCVELRTSGGDLIVFDCGTGIRELGLELLRTRNAPPRIHLLVGHTHWDHIQGFPFFVPAFLPGTELNIYAPSGFQRGLEDSLAGQMQYSYFPVKLQDLASRIHYTDLEEGFFRIGDILVETQYLNHTAPTIAYRVSNGDATVAYVTDHEPFWNSTDGGFQHPGDLRHIAFLRGADLVIHDAQYNCDEYRTKTGWGHSPFEYATDVAVAAGVARLALFHHDPLHDDETIAKLEAMARDRVAAAHSDLEVFAAAERMELDITGRGVGQLVVDAASALERRSISGSRLLLVSDVDSDISSLEQLLAEDGFFLSYARDGKAAIERAGANDPDLVIMSSTLPDGPAQGFIDAIRERTGKNDLPVLLLTKVNETIERIGNPANDYLAMPFSPPMLRTRVRAWIARISTSVGVADDASFDKRHPENDSYMKVVPTVPLFRALTPTQLSELLVSATERFFPAGHVVIRQGEPGHAVYVILNGRVRVIESLPDSPIEMFLGELGPGEVFGEIGILRERPRSATVHTLERTACLVLPEEDFLRALKGSSEMALTLLKVLAGRLSDADRLIARHAPDPLTGLPGRRAFHDMYRRLAAGARRRKAGVLLLTLDVVRLREINDRFGYSAGDDVLRSVADALMDSSRSTDLVARYGSDEFAVLLLEASENDAEVIIRRVQLKLREMAARRGLPLTVECSIGYAVSLNPPETADDLLRAADENMQRNRSVAS